MIHSSIFYQLFLLLQDDDTSHTIHLAISHGPNGTDDCHIILSQKAGSRQLAQYFMLYNTPAYYDKSSGTSEYELSKTVLTSPQMLCGGDSRGSREWGKEELGILMDKCLYWFNQP